MLKALYLSANSPITMRVLIEAKKQQVQLPLQSLSEDFDKMLDNLETLNFRAFEKGLLSDNEQATFNSNIDKVRAEMRRFWIEEAMEPSHKQHQY
jgi:hypothetical protein